MWELTTVLYYCPHKLARHISRSETINYTCGIVCSLCIFVVGSKAMDLRLKVSYCIIADIFLSMHFTNCHQVVGRCFKTMYCFLLTDHVSNLKGKVKLPSSFFIIRNGLFDPVSYFFTWSHPTFVWSLFKFRTESHRITFSNTIIAKIPQSTLWMCVDTTKSSFDD